MTIFDALRVAASPALREWLDRHTPKVEKVTFAFPPPLFYDATDAGQWIDVQSKKYGSRKGFSATAAYKAAYPQIANLHAESHATRVDRMKKALTAAGLTVGDVVETRGVGAFLTEYVLTGTIVERKGLPFVRIDPNPYTQRSLVPWDTRWLRAGAP